MIEDKLSTHQRIRLEALNQAVQHSHGRGDHHDLIKMARNLEDYIYQDGDGESTDAG